MILSIAAVGLRRVPLWNLHPSWLPPRLAASGDIREDLRVLGRWIRPHASEDRPCEGGTFCDLECSSFLLHFPTLCAAVQIWDIAAQKSRVTAADMPPYVRIGDPQTKVISSILSLGKVNCGNEHRAICSLGAHNGMVGRRLTTVIALYRTNSPAPRLSLVMLGQQIQSIVSEDPGKTSSKSCWTDSDVLPSEFSLPH